MADELVVVSQPDRPAGRRLQLRSTPVTAYAREHGIRVLTPHRLRSAEAREALAEFAPDGWCWWPTASSSRRTCSTSSAAAAQRASVVAAAPPGRRTRRRNHPRRRSGGRRDSHGDDGRAGRRAHRRALGGSAHRSGDDARAGDCARGPERGGRPTRARALGRRPIEVEPQADRDATLVRPFTRADGWIDWRRPAVEIDRRCARSSPGPARGRRSTGAASTSGGPVRCPGSTTCQSAPCCRARSRA